MDTRDENYDSPKKAAASNMRRSPEYIEHAVVYSRKEVIFYGRYMLVQLVRNLVAHGDAREGK